MDELSLTWLVCKRCGHRWLPRTAYTPLRCPECRSPYWNRDRRTPKIVEPKPYKQRCDRCKKEYIYGELNMAGYCSACMRQINELTRTEEVAPS